MASEAPSPLNVGPDASHLSHMIQVNPRPIVMDAFAPHQWHGTGLSDIRFLPLRCGLYLGLGHHPTAGRDQRDNVRLFR